MSLKNEIKSEWIYVLILWIIITWGLMLIDAQHMWRTQGQNWEHVVEPVDAWAVGATHGGKK